MLRCKTLILATITFLLILLAVPACAAGKEKVLHSFSGTDGSYPYMVNLVFDNAGNLYGTTMNGGKYGMGVVFKLTPDQNGKWSEAILYNFPGGADGAYPEAGLVFDTAGNLYGVTDPDSDNGGSVFQLIHKASGKWIENTIYNFWPGMGLYPWGGLLIDASGNLYGTAGPLAGCSGSVFRLKPAKYDGWTAKVLHYFNGPDGCGPWQSLTMDASGSLYGATGAGGAYICPSGYGCGTIFELTPDSHDDWTEKVLHSFDFADGMVPSSVAFDAKGNLYGTTYYGTDVGCVPGNNYGCGTVFELVPDESAHWTGKVLWSFYRPRFPNGGVALDAAGNIYFTTEIGGRYRQKNYDCGIQGCGGEVLELRPDSNGGWTLIGLHSFGRNSSDGFQPTGNLIRDKAGNLYGMTTYGGRGACNQNGIHGCGTVFEITP